MEELTSSPGEYDSIYDLLDKNIQIQQFFDNFNLKNLNFMQKIKIKLFGHALIQKYKMKDWKNPLPIYVFNCHRHGLQLTYPMGWNNRLICPHCLTNRKIK